jgi:hypothetical protein
MDIPLSLGGIQAVLNSALDVRDFIHDDGSGTNNVISTMALIPKQKSSGWPQAAHNGLELPPFWWDIYEASQPDASSTSRGSTAVNTPGSVAACSRAGVVPWTDIDWLNARIAASNRTINGRSCHLGTPLERFSVFNLIMAAGQWGQQRGNNNNGKDTRDANSWENYGITDPVQAGIHNLVANIYEWEDCRIESGFIQPKAYLAGATSAAATHIDYDDNALGDAAYIHQLTPGIYTITDATNGNENVTIERVIITGRFTGRAILASATTLAHIDNAPMQLTTAVDLSDGVSAAWTAIGKLLEDATGKYMALPNKADTTTHAATYLDSWYKYDNNDSRALQRCGSWGYPTLAHSGLIVRTSGAPTDTDNYIGFRAALSIGNQ